MKRREFITLLGGAAAAWPLAARAQQPERTRRVGVLMNLSSDDAEGQARLAAFHQGLQQLGWSVGGNVRIDYRWGAGDADRIRKFAAELVALAPDIILSTGSPSVAALQEATRTVPIVFVTVVDPVSSGFVDSLARLGGNITGFGVYEYSIGGKWLELLKEIAPIGRGGGNPGQCARRWRGRARYHGLRAFLEWRPDRDGKHFGDGSSRFDRHAGRPAQTARGLLRTPFRRWRRLNLLWA